MFFALLGHSLPISSFLRGGVIFTTTSKMLQSPYRVHRIRQMAAEMGNLTLLALFLPTTPQHTRLQAVPLSSSGEKRDTCKVRAKKLPRGIWGRDARLFARLRAAILYSQFTSLLAQWIKTARSLGFHCCQHPFTILPRWSDFSKLLTWFLSQRLSKSESYKKGRETPIICHYLHEILQYMQYFLDRHSLFCEREVIAF